jgi:predicted transcriptional regulator
MAESRDGQEASETLQLATEIVASYVSNNSVAVDKLPALLQEVYDAVRALARGGTASAGSQDPAVPVKKSITPDYIICLEDGKKLKMLKRYLRTQYGLSPEDYRRKWGLGADYPMVAPNYSKRRSQFAKDIGLGTVRTGSGRKPTSGKRGRPRRAA